MVDDASSDDTSAWLRDGDGPPLTAVRLERNEGMSVAKNIGFERARGELVMFLDDDDLLRSDALALLVAALRSHPRSVAAVGARHRFSGDIGSRMVHPDHLLERVIWRELLAGWSAVSGQNLYRAEVAVTSARSTPGCVGRRTATSGCGWRVVDRSCSYPRWCSATASTAARSTSTRDTIVRSSTGGSSRACHRRSGRAQAASATQVVGGARQTRRGSAGGAL